MKTPARVRAFASKCSRICASLSVTLAAILNVPPAVAATTTPAFEVERVVLLIRHGIRAPLPGESPLIEGADSWPEWQTSPGELTERGYRGARLLADHLRRQWIRLGLLPGAPCAPGNAIYVRANSLPRTIDSGRALLEGLSPGCELPLEHRPVGELDPLFSSIAADVVQFDPEAALAAVRESGPAPSVLVARHQQEFRRLGQILGCNRGPRPCDIARQFDAGVLTGERTGIRVSGAIKVGAGGAQTLLLQYLEGFPAEKVGWGRAGPREIEQLSALHSLPFVLESRPPYLARRIAGPLLAEFATRLRTESAPRIAAFVGHDNHISAVASVLSLDFHAPGYAPNDAPVGGGLMFELLRSPQSGERFVRIVYVAQTPEQLRNLTPLTGDHKPYQATMVVSACQSDAGKLCRLEQFLAAIASQHP